jgi:hypothetical protein
MKRPSARNVAAYDQNRRTSAEVIDALVDYYRDITNDGCTDIEAATRLYKLVVTSVSAAGTAAELDAEEVLPRILELAVFLVQRIAEEPK